MRVQYTVPALAELEAVLGTIFEHSPQGAGRVAARIRSTERLLAQFPWSGSMTRLPWLRRIKVASYPYLIFYEVAGGMVIIHSVSHAARDTQNLV